MRTIEWKDGVVVTIDQGRLPEEENYIELKSCEEAAAAIKEMKVRGAPLIGVTAAMGLALTAYHSKAKSVSEFLDELNVSAELLRHTRPTAVNLFWSVDRVLKRAYETSGDIEDVRKAVIEEALKMADEDVEVNRLIGKYGEKLIKDGYSILTYCNAGSLATVDYGTALGVIRSAFHSGKKIKVIAPETRPKLQGARLTTYELMRESIPVTLITDNMVGYAMSRGMVNIVIIGADRVLRDAVINKIGTYTVAVLAKEHYIPFYVAAPTSTFDLSRSSADAPIEERSPDEVRCIKSVRIAPREVDVWNPAFDVTPMRYVWGVITEKGIMNPKHIQSGIISL